MAPVNLITATLICSLLTAGSRDRSLAEAQVCYSSTMNAYWVPIEGRADMSRDGVPLLLEGPKTEALLDVNGAVIAYVAQSTLHKCKEEGACYLEDKDEGGKSKLVSYVGGANVFRLESLLQFPFGVGGWNNALEMYVSVASTDYPPGTKLYIKELDGVDLGRDPADGFLRNSHNGCVRVDDVGSSSCSLNLFLGFFSDFQRMRADFPVQVHAEPRSNCQTLFYLQTKGTLHE